MAALEPPDLVFLCSGDGAPAVLCALTDGATANAIATMQTTILIIGFFMEPPFVLDRACEILTPFPQSITNDPYRTLKCPLRLRDGLFAALHLRAKVGTLCYQTVCDVDTGAVCADRDVYPLIWSSC